MVTLSLGIAFTSSMVEPKPAANNDWSFQKVFYDEDFIAAGQLLIPPKSKKPSKGTKDNTYVRCAFFHLCFCFIFYIGLLCHRRSNQCQNSQHQRHPCNWWHVYGPSRYLVLLAEK